MAAAGENFGNYRVFWAKINSLGGPGAFSDVRAKKFPEEGQEPDLFISEIHYCFKALNQSQFDDVVMSIQLAYSMRNLNNCCTFNFINIVLRSGSRIW